MTRDVFEDPLFLVTRIANTLRRLWMVWTYPFSSVGSEFRMHYSCDLARSSAPWIEIGDSVRLDRDVWVNIPPHPLGDRPVIVFGDGCKVGRRCVISAKNLICLEKNVIFAPSVLVMDHNHAFDDVTVPISGQGITEGGTIRIEEGCWIGFGAAIVCSQGELIIGRNSVIGANSVVTKSVPPYSVVSGNPGRVVKHFDVARNKWLPGTTAVMAQPQKDVECPV